MFPLQGFCFHLFLPKFLSNCPSSTKLLLPLKIYGCAAALRNYSFCKKLHHKCLEVFLIHLCLDNCSVICEVTFRNVLHQTHSEFRHIQNSVYSDIFTHSPANLALLRNIHAYWGIIKGYSALFNTLCNPRICATLPYSELWHI